MSFQYISMWKFNRSVLSKITFFTLCCTTVDDVTTKSDYAKKSAAGSGKDSDTRVKLFNSSSSTRPLTMAHGRVWCSSKH